MALSNYVLSKGMVAGALVVSGAVLVASLFVVGVLKFAQGFSAFLAARMESSTAMVVTGLFLMLVAVILSFIAYYILRERAPLRASSLGAAVVSPQADATELTLLAAQAAKTYIRAHPEKAALSGLALGVILGMNPGLGRHFIELSKYIGR